MPVSAAPHQRSSAGRCSSAKPSSSHPESRQQSLNCSTAMRKKKKKQTTSKNAVNKQLDIHLLLGRVPEVFKRLLKFLALFGLGWEPCEGSRAGFTAQAASTAAGAWSEPSHSKPTAGLQRSAEETVVQLTHTQRSPPPGRACVPSQPGSNLLFSPQTSGW